MDQFEVSASDHRSVEFTQDATLANVEYDDLITAIEGFFSTFLKRDHTVIAVTGISYTDTKHESHFNRSLSIIELVNIYLLLKE